MERCGSFDLGERGHTGVWCSLGSKRWGREDGDWKELGHRLSGIGLSDSLWVRRTEMTSCLKTFSPARDSHRRFLKIRRALSWKEWCGGQQRLPPPLGAPFGNKFFVSQDTVTARALMRSEPQPLSFYIGQTLKYQAVVWISAQGRNIWRP